MTAALQLDLFAWKPSPQRPDRERFAELLKQRRVLGERHASELKELHDQLDQRLDDECRKLLKVSGKKTPKDRDKLRRLALDNCRSEFEAARDAASADYGASAKIRDEEQKRAESELRELAAMVEVLPGHKRLLYHETWTSTYATYGNSCISYARNIAEMRAEAPRFYGLEASVEPVKKDPRPHYGYSTYDTSGGVRSFQVMVMVAADLDVEILRRKPHPPFRDQIKSMLKRGINPRVVDPFLPFDIAQKLGLDNFGNDLPGGSSAV